jgi:ribosome-associated protein
MITVTGSIQIDEHDIQFEFIRASGPGGQNVNKVASSVQLRYDVMNSNSLGLEIKQRLLKLAKNRISGYGILIIEAKRYRTQEQNRLDAINRLITLIQKASEKPKQRIKTKPTITSKAVRVDEKKRRGEIKRTRQSIPEDW